MKDKESLKEVINLLNTGKKFPALQLVKSNLETAALMSKLVKPREESDFNINKNNSYFSLNQGQLQAISESIKSRNKDNDNILQLFPDIELAIQILVSSILSPKDMVNSVLIYKAKETILPSELLLKLNQIVSENLEGHYDIKGDLQNILRDTLFSTGSYIKAVIPESIVDEIINGTGQVSTESLQEIFTTGNKTPSLGILGNSGKTGSVKIGLESFSGLLTNTEYNPFMFSTDGVNEKDKVFFTSIEVTDNYKLLKLPKIIESNNNFKLKKILNTNPATESDKLSSGQLSNIIYKSKTGGTQSFISLPKLSNVKRKSIGRPLVLRLPSESVIPIYTPGDETKHIGYFVLIDGDGNPVTYKSNREYMDGLTNISTSGLQDKLPNMLLERARNNLIGDPGNITLDHITKVYGSIIENDLTDRIRNGIYGSGVEIGDNQEVYRIMLARSLASQYTRLVYIPNNLVTYFAFKYFNNGVGKSYLDDVKILTSLRAIMLFAKIMAMTKNSIALTHVNMTLDPNDSDPNKTVEMGIHEILRMRQQYFPLGINNPVDLVDWIQRAGFEFTFEGHPGLPDTKFDFETKNIQHTLPDDNLDELLRKQTYMAFGLSPETVDNGLNSEFATTVIANNILFSKRISILGETFSIQLTDYAQKVISSDSILKRNLLDVLRDNKGILEKYLSDEDKVEYNKNPDSILLQYIDLYIDNLQISLPKPDVTTIETQTAAFNEYTDALDKSLDSWISSEIVTTDISGDISNNIDTIKSIVKAYYIRQWMANNGYMSELSDIVTADEDGKPNIDIYELNKNHIEGITRSCLKFIKSLKTVKAASDKDIANMGVEPGEVETNDDSSTDSSDDFTFTDDSSMDDMSETTNITEGEEDDNTGNDKDTDNVDTEKDEDATDSTISETEEGEVKI